MAKTTPEIDAYWANVERVLRRIRRFVVGVLVLVLVVASVGFALMLKHDRKRMGEVAAFYPASDQDALRHHRFPWQFFKDKARRDGLTTRTQMHPAVLGYDSIETRTTDDGINDVYRFSGMIPFGDIELSIYYHKDETLARFDDLGAEVFLLVD